jgi:hypothetical protein
MLGAGFMELKYDSVLFARATLGFEDVIVKLSGFRATRFWLDDHFSVLGYKAINVRCK